MFRYIPYAIGLIALTGATWWQAQIVDRWGESSISVEALQARFKDVPLDIGPWKGVDQAVEKEVTKTAGAVAHVNRVYKNQETGDEVQLWLIVGHAKDIVRHTPNICYPAQGFRQIEPNELQHSMVTADNSEAVFWTARFTPESEAGGGQMRVFWAWSIHPGSGGAPLWEAPSSPRIRFGNTTALYKMYFTSPVKSREETAAGSPGAEFARICIPEVNKAVFSEATNAASGAGEVTSETSTETKAGAAQE